METFNHYMLTLARESRGFTQDELAERLSVGQGTLSKYETGVNMPPREFVSHLGGSLGYPEAFFYQPGRPTIPAVPLSQEEEALGESSRPDRSRDEYPSYAHKEDEPVVQSTPPNLFRKSTGTSSKALRACPTTEDLARSVREFWMLPAGPISNIVEIIEETVYCCPLRFPDGPD